jgi:hypothetical protein
VRAVITGFNTDIKHGERVFHVQTEDRGTSNPVVESLVYVGGEILLSKKSSYQEHVSEGRVDEKVVRDLMDLQHRRIIEAIRRGRFDAAKPGGQPPPDEVTEGGTPMNTVSPAAAAATAAILSSKSGSVPAVRPQSVPPAGPPTPRPRPPSSGAFRAPAMPGERSLDQVIMEYLASEAASEHLDLSLVKGGELVPGESVSLTIRAATSLTEKPVAGAHVSVRVVSTVSPPQILFRGVTGADGLVKATCTLPDLSTAHAALIVAASSPIGNNELKEAIKKKVR